MTAAGTDVNETLLHKITMLSLLGLYNEIKGIPVDLTTKENPKHTVNTSMTRSREPLKLTTQDVPC